MTNETSSNLPIGGRRPGAGWGWIFAYGVLLIIGGFLAFFNPMAAGFAAGVIFGVVLIAYGGFALIAAFSGMAMRSKALEILLGIIAILAGVFVLLNPYQGAASFAWAIGFWLFVSGVFQIVYALKGGADRGWRLALGVIDLLLGGYLVFSGPMMGIAFVAAIIGFSFVLRGIFLVSLANVIRKVATR